MSSRVVLAPEEKAGVRRDVADGPPPTVKPSEGHSKFVIKLEASLSEMDADLVQELTRLLRDHSGDVSLTIKKIREGSVILSIMATEEGGERLPDLFESGRLKELAGLRVMSVQKEVSAARNVAPLREKRVIVHAGRLAAMGGGLTVEVQGDLETTFHAPPENQDQVEHSVNRAEFQALIVQHLSLLRSQARQLCRGQMDADDVLQDCLLRAYQTRHRLRHVSRARAWLLAVVHQTFMDMVRRLEAPKHDGR